MFLSQNNNKYRRWEEVMGKDMALAAVLGIQEEEEEEQADQL